MLAHGSRWIRAGARLSGVECRIPGTSPADIGSRYYRERRVARRKRSLPRDQCSGHLVGAGPAQAHDADAASPGRRRDRHDSVVGGEHSKESLAADARRHESLAVAKTAQMLSPTVWTVRTVAATSLPQRDQHGLRKRVADALGGHARDFRDGHMDDAALVGIERTELLIGAGQLRLLREKLRHVSELDVFPFAVGERIDENAALVCQRRVRMPCRRCAEAP